MPDRTETLTFLVHAVKQFCFGVETLNSNADRYEDGSAAKAFYTTSMYNYLSIFYLLDKGADDAMGGTFYKALKPLGYQDALRPIQETLDTPIGTTTFGEAVRVFRNKVITHTSYQGTDFDRLYQHADFQDPEIGEQFLSLVAMVYMQTRELPLALAQRAGLNPTDFGIVLSLD